VVVQATVPKDVPKVPEKEQKKSGGSGMGPSKPVRLLIHPLVVLRAHRHTTNRPIVTRPKMPPVAVQAIRMCLMAH
jgi:hypothetical protein